MELHIQSLTKEYRHGKRAIKNLSVELNNGMFGLLGPNGAGKTTLMKILVTLLEPTSGTVTYDGLRLGKNNQEIRRLIGYLPQEYGLYPSLTARELLNYMATLHGKSNDSNWRNRIDGVLEQVHLSDVTDQRVGGFSGGMRQRLGIAQALLNDPKLLIVDEPTAGLDPEERVRFRNLLGQLSGDRVVILSTHIVDDISSSCDDMALLDEGSVCYRGRPSEFIEQVQGFVWSTTVAPSQVPAVEAEYRVISAVRRVDGVTLRVLAKPEAVTNLPNLHQTEPTLEDAYIWMMEQKSIKEAAL
ncbi:MAG: ABC transporter ATP-binding protein [Chloroflexi bacterium]|nr:ABC transporter ATP-binding protein [Chloroflexota bacterium]